MYIWPEIVCVCVSWYHGHQTCPLFLSLVREHPRFRNPNWNNHWDLVPSQLYRALHWLQTWIAWLIDSQVDNSYVYWIQSATSKIPIANNFCINRYFPSWWMHQPHLFPLSHLACGSYSTLLWHPAAENETWPCGNLRAGWKNPQLV